MGLSYMTVMTVITLRYAPSMCTSFRAFIINKCWILKKNFISWNDYMILFFRVLMSCVTIDLGILNHFWISVIKPTCSWYFLIYYWIWLDSMLLKNFSSIFSILLFWFFFWYFCFGIKFMLTSWSKLGSIPFSATF